MKNKAKVSFRHTKWGAPIFGLSLSVLIQVTLIWAWYLYRQQQCVFKGPSSCSGWTFYASTGKKHSPSILLCDKHYEEMKRAADPVLVRHRYR